MCIYARNEQCDLVPNYQTITNTQGIRIYPGKLKFILVKISSDPGQRRNQTLYSRFLPLRIYLDSPVHTSANTERIRVTLWAIISIRPGALGQIRHQCKSLSYAAEYLYQIC